MPKPKVAWYWCASCGGCEESFVDFAEKLLDVFEAVDIVFCPVAMDFKREDVEKMPDGSITVSFINGGIRLEEHVEMVELLRRKSQIVVAYGSCSAWGGIPGLANLFKVDELIRRKYLEVPSVVNEEGVTPSERNIVKVGDKEVELPLTKVLDRVYPLDQVIDVEYYIPGCPPTPDVALKAIQTLLSGELPPKGSVIGAESRSLCDTCPLNETKPEKLEIREFKRVIDSKPDLDKCLLAQGYLCLGPVTRGGCGALCPKVGMPCTGCFGALDGITDYGGKAISFIGSILGLESEEEIRKAYDKIPDWVGVIYKYSLPASKLGGKII